MAKNDKIDTTNTDAVNPALDALADGPAKVDRTDPTKDLFRALFAYFSRHPALAEAVAIREAIRVLVPDVEPPKVTVVDAGPAPANAKKLGR
jgi:hypothetical protein